MSNDLISREALKKHKVYSEERHEYVVPVYNIDNAPTVELLMGRMTNGVIIPIERPTGEWIPVSERLPEIATRCVVQLSNGYITIGEYFSNEKWTIIETTIQFVYPKETITAWMPLPQPYKEEAEE